MLQRVSGFEPTRERRLKVFGVDFSGASDAGAKIWVARGTIDGNSLLIEETLPAERLVGSGRGMAAALSAVRRLVESEPGAVFGFDFPFSLPAELIGALFGAGATWEQMVAEFPARFASPEEFRAEALKVGAGMELRRATERVARTPFSPYNLRLHRQTYYGIANVLSPLLNSRIAAMLPMQPTEPGKPWLLEICPASTLKRIEIYAPYKGVSPQQAANRRAILMSMKKKGPLTFAGGPDLEAELLANRGGDALDSVAAAFAVFKNLQDPSFDLERPSPDSRYLLEGWVYT